MPRRCRCFTLVLVVLAFWPASARAVDGLATGKPSGSPRLILTLRPSVDVCLDCRLRMRQAVAPAVPGSHLDALNRRFGVRSARPLRAADATLDSLAARRAAEDRRRARLRDGRTGTGPLPSFASTYVLELPDGVDVEAAAAAYARDPAVEAAEPDGLMTVQALTNDPFLTSSGAWGQDYPDLWGATITSAPQAWDVARGAGVVIAVVDTGVDFTHPDLAANAWVNPGEIPGNGIDDDGNGYVDDVHGWDFANDDADPYDDHGHGTHVAGTAAAVGDNGLGIVGIAWESRVMAVKGIFSSGSGFFSDLADGIVYATENGARVINASWGGGHAQVVDDAIAFAHAAGVVFVAAAGNANVDIGFASFWPANDPLAITVSAFTHLDARAPFSNYGPKIDVGAPGGGDAGTVLLPERSILSLRAAGAGTAMTGNGALIVDDAYVRQAGTSMATPHVAGAAAVLLSAHPDWTPEQVRQALRLGADDVGAPGWDSEAGYGRLNVAGALAVDAPLEALITAPRPYAVHSGNSVVIEGIAAGPGFASYGLDYAPIATPDAWTPFAGPFFAPVTAGTLGTFAVQSLPDGAYWVRLRVARGDGTSFEARTVVRVDRILFTEPAENSMLVGGGTIELRGSIAPGDLQSFTIQYYVREPDLTISPLRSAGLTITGGGLQPIENGVLATFDSSVLPGPRDVSFLATVTTASGVQQEWLQHVILDPTIRPGWPQYLYDTSSVITPAYLAKSTPTVADLDGDGTKEIMVALADQLYVLEPDGSPRPGWPQELWNAYGPGYIGAVGGPSAADLDGDGRLELVVATYDEVFVFHDDGTLLPGWPRYYSGLEMSDCVLADVDGDGRRDIVFRQGKTINAVDVDGDSLPGFGAYMQGHGEYSGPVFSVGDVDGDGRLEIAAVAQTLPRRIGGTGKLYLYLLDADGTVRSGFPKKAAPHPWPDLERIPLDPPSAPIMADLDGDGGLDVVVNAEIPSKLGAWRGDGKRIGLQKLTLPHYESKHSRDRQDPVIAGDVTGDGRPELFVGTELENKCFFDCAISPITDYLSSITPGTKLGNRPGFPIPFRAIGHDGIFGAGISSIGDIDGDGRQDVVVSSGLCAWWPGAGHQCFGVWAFTRDGASLPGFPKPTHAPTASRHAQAALADLDGDGLKEVVWLDYIGRLVVWNVAGTPGPEHFEWPMSRHDPAHTGALPVGR